MTRRKDGKPYLGSKLTLSEYLKLRGVTINEFHLATKIPLSSLYRICNNLNIPNKPTGILIKLHTQGEVFWEY